MAAPYPHIHMALVVDDDEGHRDALVTYLDSAGLSASGAPSAANALQALRDGACPCVLIVDVFMPEMDGWQLLARIRTSPRFTHLPVVMLSGAAADDDGRAARLGVCAQLTKPVDPTVVAESIARHCRYRPD